MRHGVNVLAGDQFTEVGVGGAVVVLVVLVDAVAGLVEVVFHDVAHGDDPGVFLIEEVAHVPLPLRPDADAADGDAVAGRDLAGPPRAEAGMREGKAAAASASPVVCFRNCRRVAGVR